MRNLITAGLALLLCACATAPSGPKIIVSDEKKSSAAPALDCPPQSRSVGLPPPDGSSARCMRQLSDGRMVAEGAEVFWYPDGRVKTRGANLEGQRHGVWEEFDTAGQKIKEISYLKGTVDGTTTEFYPTGQVKSEQHFKAGKLEGQSTHYLADGKMRKTLNYSQGVRHGEATEYFASGKMKLRGEYAKDAKSGYWTHWYADGKVCMKGRMIGGQRDGYWAYKASDGEQLFTRYTRGKTEDQPLPKASICQ